MPTPMEEYINSCRFAPLDVSQEEMELARRAEYLMIDRDKVDLIVSFLQKQVKLSPKMRKMLSTLQNFLEDSEEMRKKCQKLAEKRHRENLRREKLKKKFLDSQMPTNQAV